VKRLGGKLTLFGVMALAVLFAGACLVVASDCKTEAPEVVKIFDAKWEKHTKCPVEFSHKKHTTDYKIGCTECHHVIKDGQNVWKQGDPACPCSSCHTELTIQGEKKLSEADQKLNLKLAFHDNCTECHKKEKAKNANTTAPVTCTGCHAKECPQQ